MTPVPETCCEIPAYPALSPRRRAAIALRELQ